MGIQLSHDQWHVRLFFWSLGVWDDFLGGNDVAHVESTGRTDLCHYLRVIFLWMPLVFILHAATLGFVLYVFVYYQITRFGFDGWGMMFGVIFTAVGLIVLIKFVYNQLEERKYRSKRREYLSDRQSVRPSRVGLVTLTIKMIAAKKERICPLIQIAPRAAPSEVVQS